MGLCTKIWEEPFFIDAILLHTHEINAKHCYITSYKSVVSALTLHEHYTTLHGILVVHIIHTNSYNSYKFI